jgi:hypothetical protein
MVESKIYLGRPLICSALRSILPFGIKGNLSNTVTLAGNNFTKFNAEASKGDLMVKTA